MVIGLGAVATTVAFLRLTLKGLEPATESALDDLVAGGLPAPAGEPASQEPVPK
jgi:hypothetical protein